MGRGWRRDGGVEDDGDGGGRGGRRKWFGEPCCPLQVVPDIREEPQTLPVDYSGALLLLCLFP